MANQKKIERRKSILRARGVPEKFVEALSTRKGSGIIGLAILLPLLAGIALQIGIIFCSEPLITAIALFVYPDAPNSLLFFTPPSLTNLLVIGGVTVFVLFLLVSVTIMAESFRKIRPYPAYNNQAESLRTLRSGEVLTTLTPNTAYQNFADLPDDSAFLAAIGPPRPSRWCYLTSLFFFTPIVVIGAPAVLELRDYKIVTADAVVLHRRGGAVTYRLSDARYAYVTCYSGRENSFDYRVVYPGVTVTLWEWQDEVHRLNSAGILNRLSTIDRKLMQLNVPVHRVPNTGSPADDSNMCVDNLSYRWHLKNKAVLHRLVFGQ